MLVLVALEGSGFARGHVNTAILGRILGLLASHKACGLYCSKQCIPSRSGSLCLIVSALAVLALSLGISQHTLTWLESCMWRVLHGTRAVQ